MLGPILPLAIEVVDRLGEGGAEYTEEEPSPKGETAVAWIEAQEH
jgi:hypothetical protein